MDLKSYIKQSGERQKVWAKRLGISAPYMSLILNGKQPPSLKLAVRIERATKGKVPATSWIAE